MCELYVKADPILYESRSRSLRIRGVVTTLRLENQYFSLDVSHPLATEMLQSGTCMFYVPGMLGEPELELFAVLRT